MKDKLTSIFYIFFPLLVGGVVSFFTSNYTDYSILNKPFLSPPSILFPIVWTIIYLLMGISYFIIKKTNNSDFKIDFIYYLQLFVNVLWSIIFFVFKLRFFAVVWIIILDILVICMIYLFYKKVKLSAFFNFLYLVWILFAAYLTIGIYILN